MEVYEGQPEDRLTMPVASSLFMTSRELESKSVDFSVVSLDGGDGVSILSRVL